MTVTVRLRSPTAVISAVLQVTMVNGRRRPSGRIRPVRGDMLRVAGSLTLGGVRGYGLIRMPSRDGRLTGLGDAFAHYGRIFKILHLLQFVSGNSCQRMIGKQLNITEARHRFPVTDDL